MGKNIVTCCDGTGNQIERTLSNVLKLFRISRKNKEQHVYYSAGIGTIGSSDAWARLRQNAKSVFELTTGHGLDTEILAHMSTFAVTTTLVMTFSYLVLVAALTLRELSRV
jgi:uncharacterized protein (DUF2235 family)